MNLNKIEINTSSFGCKCSHQRLFRIGWNHQLIRIHLEIHRFLEYQIDRHFTAIQHLKLNIFVLIHRTFPKLEHRVRDFKVRDQGGASHIEGKHLIMVKLNR